MNSTSHSEIIRVVKDENYSKINNSGLRDSRLSWGAKGILAYLLTKPDNWNPTVEDLIRQAPQKKAAVRGMLDELKEHGYLKRERIKAERGRFIWQTTLYEVSQGENFSPRKKAPPSTENQHMESHAQNEDSPSTGFPSMENPYYGAPSHGKPVDIRRTERRTTEKEELSEVVVERGREETPPPQSALAISKTNDSPIFAAIFEITGRAPNLNHQRDKTELAALAPFLCERFVNEAAAATEMLRLFQFWDKATPPHLSQILQNWPRMERIEKLRSQQEQNATPIPKTANELRLEQHVRNQLERRNREAQVESDASLARLAQRR